FADREAADRITVKADFDETPRAGLAEVRNVASLRNTKKHITGRRGLERPLAALRPAQGELHRALEIAAFGRQPHTLVHLHRDLRAEQPLYLDRALRRQFHHGSVDVGTKGHRPLADLAQ